MCRTSPGCQWDRIVQFDPNDEKLQQLDLCTGHDAVRKAALARCRAARRTMSMLEATAGYRDDEPPVAPEVAAAPAAPASAARKKKKDTAESPP